MSYVQERIGDNEVYYHALYHHVAHWAAWVGMIVAEATIAAVLSTSTLHVSGLRLYGAAWAILLVTGGAVYFMLGMNTYGAILCDAVPEAYLVRTQTFRHTMTIAIGVAVALVAGGVNGILLYYLASSAGIVPS